MRGPAPGSYNRMATCGQSRACCSARAACAAVTYVANNLLLWLQDIARRSGLGPGRLLKLDGARARPVSSTRSVRPPHTSLDGFDPRTDILVGRWDFSISYGWTDGSGAFWVDTDQIRYTIQKQGL